MLADSAMRESKRAINIILTLFGEPLLVVLKVGEGQEKPEAAR